MFWIITAFILGGIIGMIGMAILGASSNAEDNEKFVQMQEVLRKIMVWYKGPVYVKESFPEDEIKAALED